MERLTYKITNIQTGDVLSYGMNSGFNMMLKGIQKLGAYEDAEEQGLLLRLPCKVGDTVYWLSNWYCIGNKYKVTEEKVENFGYDGEDIYVGLGYGKNGVYNQRVFLTKEEAEQALADMKGV